MDIEIRRYKYITIVRPLLRRSILFYYLNAVSVRGLPSSLHVHSITAIRRTAIVTAIEIVRARLTKPILAGESSFAKRRNDRGQWD